MSETKLTKEDKHRQTGRTTQQMLDAPKDAIYVVPGVHLRYFKDIARFIDRSDLQIEPSSWLWPGAAIGLNRKVVIDHYLWYNCSSRSLDGIQALAVRNLLHPAFAMGEVLSNPSNAENKEREESTDPGKTKLFVILELIDLGDRIIGIFSSYEKAKKSFDDLVKAWNEELVAGEDADNPPYRIEEEILDGLSNVNRCIRDHQRVAGLKEYNQRLRQAVLEYLKKIEKNLSRGS